MRLGPVFQAELLTLSRRGRFFVGRTLYGLLVLFIVGTTYQSMSQPYKFSGGIPIDVLASFGEAIFTAFAWLQGLILLLMTPALVAGAIAEERQRKTLHYLMASQLSSTEIVLGKVGARLLRAGVIGAIGLPVLSLISLFGGVDFRMVFLVYGATATTTFFLASVAICCSLHATKPRDSISSAYLFEFVWLTVPSILIGSMSAWTPFWQSIGRFFLPALEWIAVCSPTDISRLGSALMDPDVVLRKVLWMMGTQTAYGILLIIYAAARLRPVYRGEGAPGWLRRRIGPKQARTRWRLWPRPACGDDAMLWKEMHLHRIGSFKRAILILISVAAIGMTIYSAWDIAWGALTDTLNQGWTHYGSNQSAVNSVLRGVNAVLIVVILVGLGSVAASSISSEREGDTWTNLTSSPLEGSEVVRAKILGSIWLFRSSIGLLLVCWTFGLAVGAINPLGLMACVIELAIFTWFTAALGVSLSLRSKNTIQALTLTVGILSFLNVGILILGTMLAFLAIQSEFEFILIACMPFHFTVSLLGMNDLNNGSSVTVGRMVGVVIAGTVLYGFAAVWLTYRAIERYNIVVDRPDRQRNSLTPAQLLQARQAAPKGLAPREL